MINLFDLVLYIERFSMAAISAAAEPARETLNVQDPITLRRFAFADARRYLASDGQL